MNEKFSNRCRACTELDECSEKMISLCEGNLSEMFTHCTSLQVSPDDKLPSSICFRCFDQLSHFDQFRQNCAKSQKFFLEQIAAESIKAETLNDSRIQTEEDKPNPVIKCELLEIEYCAETEIDIESPTTPDPISNVNPFDGQHFVCDYCGKVFDKKSHIGSHMVKHKNDLAVGWRSENFSCTLEGCAKIFATKKGFSLHRLKVHKLKPESIENAARLSCEKCPKMFTAQFKLDAHVRLKHEKLKPYKCTEEDCAKEFSKYRLFEHHLQFVHNVTLNTTAEQKIYKCDYSDCGKVYGLIDSLKAHINRSHLGIIPVRRNQKLICDQCGRSFTNGYTLKKHIYSHTGKLPYACKICPKTFLTNSELKMHTMRHLKIKPFECPTCGVRKTTNKELQSHLNFHSNEITYPCKECPRVFTSYGAHGRHVRIHHRNHKPYICPYCQRAFAKAETMKNHVMTHTGEKPFSCSVCGHRFIQSVALKAHMKTHKRGIAE